MYKNFSLTDKEKKEILEQHGRHGYKQPKEQISRKKNMMLGEMLEPFSNINGVKPQHGRIYFNNGGDISVQASRFHYSTPRDDQGPYTHVELGYPSRGTKITDSFLKYAEDSSRYDGGDFDPYNTVYGYVPLSVIKELIDANGGIKSGELPPMEDEYDDYEEIQERKYGKKKPLNEQPFGDDGKFTISHVGIPVKEIKVNVDLSEDYENDSVRFTLEIDDNKNLMIVDFENESGGEIDDNEVISFMKSIIANNELNIPDYIDYNPETGQYKDSIRRN
jgi:hypothetical protein